MDHEVMEALGQWEDSDMTRSELSLLKNNAITDPQRLAALFGDDLGKGEREKALGQVLTPEPIAKLISHLSIRSHEDRVIDPCFGEGVFLEASIDRLMELEDMEHISKRCQDRLNQLMGVELDPFLFVRGVQNIAAKCECGLDTLPTTLFFGDFFDLPNMEGEYDVGVMNPPYVRQETLGRFWDLQSKKGIWEKCLSDTGSVGFSKRSNLYVYFVVHLARFLKEGGILGAITPNTWLSAKFGEALQEFILDNFQIEFVIDFDDDVFPGAMVESCITVLKKRGSEPEQDRDVRFIRIKRWESYQKVQEIVRVENQDTDNADIRIRNVDQDRLRRDRKWEKFLSMPDLYFKLLESENFIPLSDLVRIRRGLTTGCNDFYTPDVDTVEEYGMENGYLDCILRSPKAIDFFSTRGHPLLSPVLSTSSDKGTIAKAGHYGILKYIEDWEEVLSKEGSKKKSWQGMARKIAKDPQRWFNLSLGSPSAILFAYIIRENKFFVLNEGGYHARDNFYCIDPIEKNELLIFGLLNSTVTRLMLEGEGRKHGRGLLKVQAYELGTLPMVNPEHMAENTRHEIADLAGELAKRNMTTELGTRNIIEQIDSLILDTIHIDLDAKALHEVERDLVHSRLRRRGGTLSD